MLGKNDILMLFIDTPASTCGRKLFLFSNQRCYCSDPILHVSYQYSDAQIVTLLTS
jgi:hypothetical protein